MYGRISVPRECDSMWRSLRWPKRVGPPFSLAFQYDHMSFSLVRCVQRHICRPHVCTESVGKLNWESGMRISAVQPSESIRVATSHTGSHDASQQLPPGPNWSCFTPDGFTVKNARPRWSWNVSKMIWM